MKSLFKIVFIFHLFLIDSGCGNSPDNRDQDSAETEPVPQTEPQETKFDYYHSRLNQNSLIQTDWPRMGGPYFNSSTDEQELSVDWGNDLPPILWEQSVGTGYSMPIVHDGEIYLFHRQEDQEIIDSRNSTTGQLNWQFGSPTNYECQVAYSNGPYSTPVLDGTHIYALGTEAKLYCISRDDGDLVWMRDLQLEYEPEVQDFPVGSSPIVIGDTIYINLGGTKPESTIIAINTKTSETRWTAISDGRSYASPQYAYIHDSPHLIIFSDRFVSSLNPTDGSKRWSVEFGVKKSPNRVNAVTPLIIDNKIIATAGPGAGIVCLLILPDGGYREIWRHRRNLDSQFSNIVCVNNSIFGFTSKWNRSAELRCLSLRNGEIQWNWPSNLMRGSICAADGKLFLFGEDGHLAVMRINSSQSEVLFHSESPILQKPTYSAPVIADGKLFLRDEHKLIAISLGD